MSGGLSCTLRTKSYCTIPRRMHSQYTSLPMCQYGSHPRALTAVDHSLQILALRTKMLGAIMHARDHILARRTTFNCWLCRTRPRAPPVHHLWKAVVHTLLFQARRWPTDTLRSSFKKSTDWVWGPMVAYIFVRSVMAQTVCIVLLTD